MARHFVIKHLAKVPPVHALAAHLAGVKTRALVSRFATEAVRVCRLFLFDHRSHYLPRDLGIRQLRYKASFQMVEIDHCQQMGWV